MRTFLAVLIGLSLVGCSAASEEGNGDNSATASAAPTPRSSVVDGVRAPVVLGEVPIQDTSPERVIEERMPAPTGLAIEALGIDMVVTDVGLEPDGSMEIPESAAVAGWYRYGPAPGSGAGNAVLAAHVDDAQIGLGPFYRLLEIEVGAQIVVTNANGEDVAYQVDRVEQTDKQVVDMDTVFDRGGEHQLVLVTCGGRWNRDAGHYDDNVVVYATKTNAPAR